MILEALKFQLRRDAFELFLDCVVAKSESLFEIYMLGESEPLRVLDFTKEQPCGRDSGIPFRQHLIHYQNIRWES